MLKEELLYWYFPEYVEGLFELDKLKGVFAGDVDGSFDEGYSCECSTELVHLESVNRVSCSKLANTYPVNQAPVPNLLDKRHFLDNATESRVFVYSRVRRENRGRKSKDPQFSRSPFGMCVV